MKLHDRAALAVSLTGALVMLGSLASTAFILNDIDKFAISSNDTLNEIQTLVFRKSCSKRYDGRAIVSLENWKGTAEGSCNASVVGYDDNVDGEHYLMAASMNVEEYSFCESVQTSCSRPPTCPAGAPGPPGKDGVPGEDGPRGVNGRRGEDWRHYLRPASDQTGVQHHLSNDEGGQTIVPLSHADAPPSYTTESASFQKKLDTVPFDHERPKFEKIHRDVSSKGGSKQVVNEQSFDSDQSAQDPREEEEHVDFD
ncbi:hypothetical protein NECAME_00765 [Necator americanus]|uniref:Collagen triple helix repeat protein n=1 Tax=Necator americanus TaxID=51031 RepID=W2SYG9_NECAM|nr:hypothetical protein NECAME_00765 [Necator americanus]ETN73677.1 hypothetical protein NECAME_00765 [Necator americanus]